MTDHAITTSPQETTVDLAIIGAGPSGLFAAFEAGMHEMSCAIFDALPRPGGQLMALYPEKPIYDIPGFPSILAKELAARLVEQIRPFHPQWCLGEQVERLERGNDQLWRVGNGSTLVHARAVIIAAGVGAFSPRRPVVEGLSAFEEGGAVHYRIADPTSFEGKRVVILGGGDSAVDWTTMLSGIARETHVVHRRASFIAHPASIGKMERLVAEGKVQIHTPFELKGLAGCCDALTVTVGNPKESMTIEADALIPMLGFEKSLGPIEGWGIGAGKGGIEVQPTTMATDQPLLYVIGDMASYPGKLKLILAGFAEAAYAVTDAWKQINPDKAYKHVYSTNKGVSR